MKFFCEYCGNRIDAEKDHKCPHCGASYRKNKSFIKLEEEKKQKQQMFTENSQRAVKTVFGVFALSKIFILVPIVIFVIIIISAINISNNSENSNENDSIEEITEDFFEDLDLKDSEEEKVTVNFNEFGETKKYKVKVEKYEVVEDIFHHADPGYELVKFHLVVENKTTKEIDREDVNCIVDGVAQNNDKYAGHSDLPFFISRELAVKGTATFIVPIDATSYDIRYGDYVTIHIEK